MDIWLRGLLLSCFFGILCLWVIGKKRDEMKWESKRAKESRKQDTETRECEVEKDEERMIKRFVTSLAAIMTIMTVGHND